MSRPALFAALPMYDLPQTAAANDALWAAIAASLRAAGVEASVRLRRGGDIGAQWRDPRLIFGQTCGYPYVKELHEWVALIATPHYSFPGCAGSMHRSFIVRRQDDARRDLAEFRGARAAINGWTSNTGMNLFRAAIAPMAGDRPFFGEVVVTGSHVQSIEAVADGRADIAAIDCVTFALVERADPDVAARVAVVGETPVSPCLPFIASARLPDTMIAAVRQALLSALDDPLLARARAALGLIGASPAAPTDYRRVLEIEQEAEAAGYAQLA